MLLMREEMVAEHIGLIGIGAMGGPIGHNLLKAGHALAIYSRTRTRPEVEQLLQAEAIHVCPSGAAGPGQEGYLGACGSNALSLLC